MTEQAMQQGPAERTSVESELSVAAMQRAAAEPARAATACREALRLQPDLQPARNNLALAYEAAGDLPGAFGVFASSDEKGRAEYNAGVVHLARRRYADALKAFEAAQRLRPRFRAAEAMARQARWQLTQGSEP